MQKIPWWRIEREDDRFSILFNWGGGSYGTSFLVVPKDDDDIAEVIRRLLHYRDQVLEKLEKETKP